MSANSEQDQEDVLVCEFAKRPRNAPTVFDVLPSVRGVTRHPAALEVAFDPNAAATVAAYVAAEQICCPTLRWDLQTAPEVRLTVRGTPGQVEQLTLLFSEPAQ
jgi:hypothetical protein